MGPLLAIMLSRALIRVNCQAELNGIVLSFLMNLIMVVNTYA